MEIQEYQRWLDAWDRERGWDRVSTAHTLVHAMEEMGEVARLVLRYEGYKDAGDPAQMDTELSEELADLLVFLFKLANQMGVDVQSALKRGQEKMNRRYGDLADADAELARYEARQAELRAGQES